MRNAADYLHRTKQESNPKLHKIPVCVTCERFILGTEKIHHLTMRDLKNQKDSLSVDSFEKYYNIDLPQELKNEYRIPGLDGLLLSPKSSSTVHGYSTCSDCYNHIKRTKRGSNSPPPNAIANGFVIGTFPDRIKITGGPNIGLYRDINVEDDNDVSEVMRSLISPVRPYGYVFAYTAGHHQRIEGHYQFYEMDHEMMNASMNTVARTQPNIYVMLCGAMTTDQKRIIKNRVNINTQKYLDIMHWFIKNSKKQSMNSMTPPSECPTPLIFEDDKTSDDNTGDKSIENSFGGGTYYFSPSQTPTNQTSVFQTQSKFAQALFNKTAPTLLVYGGNRTNLREADIEDVLPLAFPYGLGGPKTNRRTKIPLTTCLMRYMRTANPAMMRSDVIFIIEHMLERHLTYNTGVMKLKNKINGIPTGEIIGRCGLETFVDALDNNNDDDNPTNPVVLLKKTVETTCQAVGHTEDAAKYARQCHFSLLDHFGLNSLFLSITPDDECSFRVRLYSKPGQLVSKHYYHYYNL